MLCEIPQIHENGQMPKRKDIITKDDSLSSCRWNDDYELFTNLRVLYI